MLPWLPYVLIPKLFTTPPLIRKILMSPKWMQMYNLGNKTMKSQTHKLAVIHQWWSRLLETLSDWCMVETSGTKTCVAKDKPLNSDSLRLATCLQTTLATQTHFFVRDHHDLHIYTHSFIHQLHEKVQVHWQVMFWYFAHLWSPVSTHQQKHQRPIRMHMITYDYAMSDLFKCGKITPWYSFGLFNNQ